MALSHVGHATYSAQTGARLDPLLCVVVAAVVICNACGDPRSTGTKTVVGGDRPVTVQVPRAYDARTAWPLLIVLHGLGADGRKEQDYLQLLPLVDEEGVLLAAPDGTVGRFGRFWNATDCCGDQGPRVDDVAFLSDLIDKIEIAYHVDRTRVFLIGHSNGGFMAHRMACDRAEQVTAIVSLAGATWLDKNRCAPSSPVSVLQIHGDRDEIVAYDGAATYPSATATVADWAAHDRCGAASPSAGVPVDIETRLPGAETTTARFAGCPNGVGVELWTIVGGRHIPFIGPNFRHEVWRWLSEHGRR